MGEQQRRCASWPRFRAAELSPGCLDWSACHLACEQHASEALIAGQTAAPDGGPGFATEQLQHQPLQQA